jgi:hypothetical protein
MTRRYLPPKIKPGMLSRSDAEADRVLRGVVSRPAAPRRFVQRFLSV